MSSDQFDVVVIGGGPGGYITAIRAAQLGLKVALVERYKALGGTCLNVGCIPSKSLLQSSHLYHEAKTNLASHGITVSDLQIDLAQMLARKDKIVSGLNKGIDGLLKKNKVTRYHGFGRIPEAGTVIVKSPDLAEITIKARSIVIATGSDVLELDGVPLDEKRIVSSTGALKFESVPNHLAVIGAGVIGLELGSVWARLGAKVTVFEFMDRVLAPFDAEVSSFMRRMMEKQGMTFRLSTRVTRAVNTGDGVTMTVEPVEGGPSEDITADAVLVAVGRRACTDWLGIEELGIETTPRGFILVDEEFQTNIPGVYAIGDVIGGVMLAHKAEEEGVAVAEILAGQHGHVNYEAIPSVVYTAPEVASVGNTEDQLKAAGVRYRSGRFSFNANSRARTIDASDGFVKILADAETDQILGAHIVGPAAGDLIAEIVMAIEFGASSEDIARICHAHPGLAEAVKEAALAVDGRAIHM